MESLVRRVKLIQVSFLEHFIRQSKWRKFILGICFLSPSELKEKQEYERVAFPKTVPEMMAINTQEKQERREKIQAREAQIEKNLEKLDQWKKDIEMRKDKKETVRKVNKISFDFS